MFTTGHDEPRGGDHMCENCQQPVKLMDKPENCSPAQIKECHGDVKEHPCIQKLTAPDEKKEK